MSVAPSVIASWRYDWLTGAYFVGLIGVLACLALQRHRTGPYGGRNLVLMSLASASFACLTQWGSFLMALHARLLTLVDPRTYITTDFPLVFNGGLLALAVIVTFVFALFAIFCSGHTWRGWWPSVVGSALCLAVGAGLGTFIQFTAIRSPAGESAVDPSLAGACAAITVVGLSVGQAVFAASQAAYKASSLSFAASALLLSLAAIAMNSLAVASASFSVSMDDIVVPGGVTIPTALAVVWVFLSLGLAMIVASIMWSLYLRYRSPAHSSSVILSAFIMDGEMRVLVTDTGDLPSYTLTLTYGAGFDSNHRDFLTMLAASTKWQAAFEACTGNNDGDEKVRVLTAMLEGCCSLSNTLRIPVKQLGLLFTELINERLVLVSQHTQSESRFTDNGLLRWVPVRALPDWQPRYAELAAYHKRARMSFDEHASVTNTVAVTSSVANTVIEITKDSVPASPRARNTTISKSAPVQPINHDSATAETSVRVDQLPNDPQCPVFLSLLYSRIVGQSLQVLTAKRGANYMTPIIRLRGDAAMTVGDTERQWLEAMMRDEILSVQDIVVNAANIAVTTPFQRAFVAAIRDLAAFLGTGCDLTFSRLHTAHPLLMGSNQLLVFSATVMSAQWPQGYDQSKVEFSSMKSFEILHSAKLATATSPSNWAALCIASAMQQYDRIRAFDHDRDRAWGQEVSHTNNTETHCRALSHTTSPVAYHTATASMLAGHLRNGSRGESTVGGTPNDSRAASPRVSRLSSPHYERRDSVKLVNGARVTVVEMVCADRPSARSKRPDTVQR